MRNVMLSGLMALAAVMACSEDKPEPTTPSLDVAARRGGTQEQVSGGGKFFSPDFGLVTFAFVATRHGDGTVSGAFFQDQHDQGFTYAGRVTCFAIDRENGRAWIGGKLTFSNDPSDITGAGDDVWFRVLDRGESDQPDRSTFMGFEGAAGVRTSKEYCEVKLWAPMNARTWRVTKGEISIH